MDRIPYSAVALAIGVLILVWFFLLDMILSRTARAQLQILLDVMTAKKEESNSFSIHRLRTDSSK